MTSARELKVVKSRRETGRFNGGGYRSTFEIGDVGR